MSARATAARARRCGAHGSIAPRHRSSPPRSGRRWALGAWLLALLLSGCIDLDLPPSGIGSRVCSTAMREGFLQTTPGSLRRDLWIAFVDVGHGDATWLRTPGIVGVDAGELLIDAGDDGLPVASHVPDGGRAVRALMARAGMAAGAPLDAVLITHPDKDHYGGVASVLARHPAAQVLYGGRPPDGPTWSRLRTTAELTGAAWQPAPDARARAVWPRTSAGWRWRGEPAVSVLFADPTAEEDNDTSLIIDVRFAGRRILLMGDGGISLEERLLDRLEPVDVLRTGHHGGLGTSGEAFLDAVVSGETHAVISAGERQGLPHPTVVERLSARLPGRLWRTDRGDLGRSRRAAAGDDHVIARVGADDGRVEICFLDPDPNAGVGEHDP